MSLIDVNTLINELVPDQSISKNSKKVGVYAGSFKPPTKGHFAVVQKALRDNPDLDELNIFVGTGVRDGIDQSQSMLIWDIYKKYLPFKVNIMPVTKPPIKAVYDYAKENQDEQVSWIIGAREGNEDDFKDIADRTKAADNYKNLVVRPTITQSGASGTAARNASKVSQEKLEPLLPKNLNQQEKDDVFNILNRRLTEADPKKGTGKKPKGSGRRLYTDEDPKDTVGVKFSTRQDIVDTLNKKSFKAKSHARQSQIINLIHQRVRAALSRTKDPAKKKKLKSGFEYIKQRKEASKKKTQRLKKKKVNEKKGFGKSGYRYRSIYKKNGKFYFMQDNPFSPGIRQEFGPYKTKEAAKRKMQSFPPGTSYRDLTEEELFEKLCKRGKAYIAKRKREGEKHNPFLAGRAVKVCKGQMSGVDGKQKKDFRPKKGKSRSAQGRKPDIVKEIGINLSNYSGQVLPGDVLRAPKGFPLGGKKLEKSKQLKVIKNSREGVNRYKLSLEDSDGKRYTVRNFQMDGEYKGKKLPKWGMVRRSKQNIKEILKEVLDPKTFNFGPLIDSLTASMENDGLNLKPYPRIRMIHDEEANADNFFGMTAYYDPNNREIVLYTLGRHPKDIMRSYAHELVHVHQHNEDRLHDIKTDNVNADKHLENLEREAYETGNIMFRSWTNSITEKKTKDPFGLNAYARELAQLNEQKENFYIYLDMDGVVANFNKRFKDLSGLLPDQFIEKNGKNAFWELIDEKHKVAFWRGIEIMPGAEKLVNFVSQYPYEMLTAPSTKKQSVIGKSLWIRDKVGTLYPSQPKVTYRSAKEKHNVKPELTKFDILIDDKKSTIDRWDAKGGTAIFYQNADQVINDLKKLGL
jgi:PAS domain-containing protein